MSIIEWTARARRQFRRIDAVQRKTILRDVGNLKAWPACHNVKPLTNREGYRLRVGRYRVLFTVYENGLRVILIEEVKKRDERTY